MLVRRKGTYKECKRLVGISDDTVRAYASPSADPDKNKYFDIEFAKRLDSAFVYYRDTHPDENDELIHKAAQRLAEDIEHGSVNRLIEYSLDSRINPMTGKVELVREPQKERVYTNRNLQQWKYRAVIPEAIFHEKGVLFLIANQEAQVDKWGYSPEEVTLLRQFLARSKDDFLEYLQLRGLPTAQLEEGAS